MQQNRFIILCNCSSGSSSKDEIIESITACFNNAQVHAEVVAIHDTAEFFPKCKSIIESSGKDAVIVAAGGDGSVNTIAGLCAQHKTRLGIIPLGTFNYFARDLHIPLTIKDAVDVILKGHTRQVAVGKVAEYVFLNNASFGLYKKLIETREQHKSRFGRLRIVACVSAIFSFFYFQKSFAIKIASEGREQVRRTAMVFVGNNTLQLDAIGLSVAECTQHNLLAVLILKEMNVFRTICFLVRGLFGLLKTEPNLEQFCSDTFEVSSKRPFIEVAVDGEIRSCKTPLTFSIEPLGIEVLVPEELNA